MPLRTYHYHAQPRSLTLHNQTINTDNATATDTALAMTNSNALPVPPVNTEGGAVPVAVPVGFPVAIPVVLNVEKTLLVVAPTTTAVAPGARESGVPDTVIWGPPGTSV